MLSVELLLNKAPLLCEQFLPKKGPHIIIEDYEPAGCNIIKYH